MQADNGRLFSGGDFWVGSYVNANSEQGGHYKEHHILMIGSGAYGDMKH